MIAIDLGQEERHIGEELAKKFPNEISAIDGRAIDGTTLSYLSIFVSAAGIAIPEVRKIVVEIIRAKRHKAVTLKGIKLQGYSDEEIKNILAELHKVGDKS